MKRLVLICALTLGCVSATGLEYTPHECERPAAADSVSGPTEWRMHCVTLVHSEPAKTRCTCWEEAR